MSKEVFISYSNDADESLVNSIRLFFEQRLISVFSYKHEEDRYGESLTNIIDNEIKDCKYFFLLATDRAMSSKWINFEIGAAKKYKKRLFVLKYKGIDIARLPEDLRDIKVIEFTYADEVVQILTKMDEWGLNVYIPAGGFGAGKIEFSPDVPKVLYPIGDRPMLFHVINALVSDAFNKVIIINKRTSSSELIEYLTGLETYRVEVICKSTDLGNWPEALVELKPKNTFVLQLCDVILWLQGDSSLSTLRVNWNSVVEQHKRNRQKPDYLGTLIVSRHYKIPAGKVDVEEGNTVKSVEENPLTKNMTISYINTGTAILEPDILNYVESTDESLLGEGIQKAMKDGKQFGAFIWGKWYHILNQDNWNNLHREYLTRIKKED